MKKKLVVAVLVLVLAGLAGTIAGLYAQPAIREVYYRAYATQFEAKWECVDVIGIREIPGTNILAFIIELNGQNDCFSKSGKDFIETFPLLIEKANLFGGHIVDYLPCVRLAGWPAGLCQMQNGMYIPYPEEYNMWNGR